MHNSFSVSFSTPVNIDFQPNTFSGQQGGNLWVTRAQTRGLSTTLAASKTSVWVTGGGFAQPAAALYTRFPTANLANFTVLKEQLSPQSTGPIKKTTKFKKKLGDS